MIVADRRDKVPLCTTPPADVLREVALRGSFSAAAEALDYTQPAVSQQIARLEKQVGVKLIERDPRGIRLTPGGEARPPHRAILAQIAAPSRARRVAAQARGRLRIGRSPPPGTLVPRAVAAFRRLRPAVEVELSLMDPPESIPAVRRGDLEIAITEEGGFAATPTSAGSSVEHLLTTTVDLAPRRPSARTRHGHRPRRPARRATGCSPA